MNQTVIVEIMDMKRSIECIKNGFTLKNQGAEAKIYSGFLFGKPSILKERFPKTYRHPDLDNALTKERMKAEGRALLKCRIMGVKTPAVYFVDFHSRCIVMEHIEDATSVKDYIKEIQKENKGEAINMLKNVALKIGKNIAVMHKNNLIHGDLTTSNMLLKNEQRVKICSSQEFDLVFIDFGLSYQSLIAEDKGVDLYVLERAFLSTHPNSEELFEFILKGYKETVGKIGPEVLKKLDEVRLRGRKRTMVG